MRRELHVAICGDVAVGQESAMQALDRCVGALDPTLNVTLAPIEELPTSLDAVECIANPSRDTPIDLLIIDEDLSGLSGIPLVRELRAVDRNVCIVMLASDSEQAYDAMMAESMPTC